MVGAALSPVIGKLVEGHRPRPFIVFGLACSALSMFALALLDTTSSVFLHLLPGLTVNSIGFAFVAISTKVAPTERVAPEQQGRVSALITMSGRLATGFGATFAAGVFHARAASVVGPVDRVVEEAFMNTLTDLLATAGVVMVVGTVLAAWLTGPGGRGGRGSSG